MVDLWGSTCTYMHTCTYIHRNKQEGLGVMGQKVEVECL